MKNGGGWKLVLIGWLILGLAATVLWAQDAKLPDAQRAQLQEAISKFMAANHVPGLSAAVVENGEYIWSEGFGMADVENYVPATSETLYRLASISKPLTATAVMQLWEKGKLDLDAPIQKYCPAFPQKPWPITTRELLGHLSGIRHYRAELDDDPEINNTKHFDSIQAGMAFFANDPLLAPPGTKMIYTTHGYTVVGCVLEGATGKKYADYMRETIFTPAGMTHTQPDNLRALIPYRTRGYQKDKSGAVENAGLLDSSYKVPGGGILSSAEDMARFEVAILNDRLVSRGTRDLMWTPLKPSDGSPDDYGLGWSSGHEGGLYTVGHGGSQQGTSTGILMAPEKRAGVVVLINIEGMDSSAIAHTLLNIVVQAGSEAAKH